MLVINPNTARRPPAPAPVRMAPLDDEDEDVDDGLVPVLEGFFEPVLVPEVEVEFVVEFEDEDEALAAAWNSSNVSLAAKLTANTWPSPAQWPVWRQKKKSGVVSFMVRLNVSVVLSETGSKPESMPPSSASHGLSKDDCVTEWFDEGKVNTITSPALAVTLVGEKAVGSSVTWMSAANADVAAPMARIAEARVKRIFKTMDVRKKDLAKKD